MNNIEDYQKLILVKKDAKALRTIIFGENDKNDWDKLIIIYTMFLMYQHLFLVYQYMNIVSKSGPYEFKKDFINLYMFFFFICSLRGVYGSMIYSIGKVDCKLANSMHGNMGEYFDY